MKARHVFYEGRVQGVGFRFTARQIATGFDVTGWVKNLPDGRVEMLAAAYDEAELDEFLQSIRDSALASFIRKETATPEEAPAGLRGFEIAN
jgi:acylphosphatase